MFAAAISPGRLSYVWRSASSADPRLIEIAREGQQGSRQDAFCLPALHGASGRDIVPSATAQAAERGCLAPPLARNDRRPAKNGYSQIHRTCGNVSGRGRGRDRASQD
jgi:hypothetical protein